MDLETLAIDVGDLKEEAFVEPEAQAIQIVRFLRVAEGKRE